MSPRAIVELPVVAAIMMGWPSAKRAHTNPPAFERLFEGRRPATIRSADQKVGTEADGGKQSDAQHHLFMAAHSLLGPTDRQRAHDRHGAPSILYRACKTIRRL